MPNQTDTAVIWCSRDNIRLIYDLSRLSSEIVTKTVKTGVF